MPKAKPTPAPEAQPPFDYSAQMRALNQMVQQLESGQVDFEQSIQILEQGLGIADACEKYLANAEQKLLKLSRTEDGYALDDADA